MDALIKLLLISLITTNHAMATPADEVLVNSAYAQGVNIYNSCIAIPPTDPHVLTYCTTLYAAYLATLSLINGPFPILPTPDPSPYSWSIFDICRYETAHMVFNSVMQTPYFCPTV